MTARESVCPNVSTSFSRRWVGPSSFAYWRLDTSQLCTLEYSLRRSAPTHQCLQIDEANIIFDWITWSVCAAICINHIGLRIALGWCHDDKLSRWRTLSMGSWCGWYCARPHCSKSSLALRVLVSSNWRWTGRRSMCMQKFVRWPSSTAVDNPEKWKFSIIFGKFQEDWGTYNLPLRSN